MQSYNWLYTSLYNTYIHTQSTGFFIKPVLNHPINQLAASINLYWGWHYGIMAQRVYHSPYEKCPKKQSTKVRPSKWPSFLTQNLVNVWIDEWGIRYYFMGFINHLKLRGPHLVITHISLDDKMVKSHSIPMENPHQIPLNHIKSPQKSNFIH